MKWLKNEALNLKNGNYDLVETWECEWKKLPLYKNNKNMEVVEPIKPRDSYNGGRLKTVSTKDKKIKYIDVCSLHPTIMESSWWVILGKYTHQRSRVSQMSYDAGRGGGMYMTLSGKLESFTYSLMCYTLHDRVTQWRNHYQGNYYWNLNHHLYQGQKYTWNQSYRCIISRL